MAIASLVLAILWRYGLGSIAAILLGRSAHHPIEASDGTQTGASLATAGVVVGWIGLGFALILTVLLIGGRAA